MSLATLRFLVLSAIVAFASSMADEVKTYRLRGSHLTLAAPVLHKNVTVDLNVTVETQDAGSESKGPSKDECSRRLLESEKVFLQIEPRADSLQNDPDFRKALVPLVHAVLDELQQCYKSIVDKSEGPAIRMEQLMALFVIAKLLAEHDTIENVQGQNTCTGAPKEYGPIYAFIEAHMALLRNHPKLTEGLLHLVNGVLKSLQSYSREIVEKHISDSADRANDRKVVFSLNNISVIGQIEPMTAKFSYLKDMLTKISKDQCMELLNKGEQLYEEVELELHRLHSKPESQQAFLSSAAPVLVDLRYCYSSIVFPPEAEIRSKRLIAKLALVVDIAEKQQLSDST